jgi:uncharacterized membrane protein YhaH (DUF805 family)
MTLNLDPKQQTVRSFIKLKTNLNILIYIAIFFICLSIATKRYADVSFLGLPANTEFALGIGIGIVLVIIAFYLWRCPSCGKRLGFTLDPKSCSRCKAVFTPDWKPDSDQPIFTAFTRKKRTRYIFYVLLIIALFLSTSLLGQYQSVPFSVWFLILAVILIAFGIGDILYWRCPNCNSHLGRAWNPKNCPRCDVTLRK